MTEFDSNAQRLDLRPTLIIGLGGTGCRIAVELKARLQEQFGSGIHDRVLRIVCFDTASESFTARMPNAAERTVQLDPEQEFVRISDVPLYDLKRSPDSSPAIYKILPRGLNSTQIDQGAQQVRRLGRVALFYHDSEVRSKLLRTIQEMRGPENIGLIGTVGGKALHVVDRKRLRVYILGSLCGGTGSGMFLDMAYLVRHIAVEAGLSSTRQCDVTGMLLLPEAFPEVHTTGSQRIRANAYGALLDLEYHNRPTAADEYAYEAEWPSGWIRMDGPPFSLCYLVSQGSREVSLDNVGALAPTLADALNVMLTSKGGEKFDATLDNIRSSLTLYRGGYRAFYSAVGFSQIIYPLAWIKRRFGQRLMAHLIKTRLMDTANSDYADEAENWFSRQTEQTAAALEDGLSRTNVALSLGRLRAEIDASDDPISDLEAAYGEALQAFRQGVEMPLEAKQMAVQQRLESVLKLAVTDYIDKNFTQPRGLLWVDRWLSALSEKIRTRLESRSQSDLNARLREWIERLLDRAGLPLIGQALLRQQTRIACADLSSYLNGIARREAINRTQTTILTGLLAVIESQRKLISRAVSFWDSHLRAEQEEALPTMSRVTQITLDIHQLNDDLNTVFNATRDNPLLYESAANVLGQFSRTLQPAQTPELLQTLRTFCEAFYLQQADPNTVRYLKQLESNLEGLSKMGQMGQPLLVYRSGQLRALPPRQIKILGTTSMEHGTAVRRGLNEEGDLSIAPTFDPFTDYYLNTHHGIPITALAKFEDYQQFYFELRRDPDNVFHLDDARETQPYDPGSFYFVNLIDFELTFARALALRWVTCQEGAAGGSAYKLFTLQADFYATLQQTVELDLRQQENALALLRKQAEETSAQQGDGYEMNRDVVRLRDQIEFKRRASLDLKTRFEQFKSVKALNYALDNTQDDQQVVLTRGFRDNVPLIASDLPGALDALYQEASRMLPRLFEAAFADHLKITGVDEARHIRHFLSVRHFEPQNHDRQTTYAMQFSQPGQLGYDLEVKLCGMLAVYERVLRGQQYRARWGYYGGKQDTAEDAL